MSHEGQSLSLMQTQCQSDTLRTATHSDFQWQYLN